MDHDDLGAVAQGREFSLYSVGCTMSLSIQSAGFPLSALPSAAIDDLLDTTIPVALCAAEEEDEEFEDFEDDDFDDEFDDDFDEDFDDDFEDEDLDEEIDDEDLDDDEEAIEDDEAVEPTDEQLMHQLTAHIEEAAAEIRCRWAGRPRMEDFLAPGWAVSPRRSSPRRPSTTV